MSTNYNSVALEARKLASRYTAIAESAERAAALTSAGAGETDAAALTVALTP